MALEEPAKFPKEEIEELEKIEQDGYTYIYLPEVRYSANCIVITTRNIAGKEKLVLYNDNFAPELELRPTRYSSELEIAE